MRLAISMLCIALTSNAFAQEQLQILNTQPGAKAPEAASYGLGYDVGMSLTSGGLELQDINQQDLIAGLIDGLAGKEPKVDMQAVQAAMQVLQQKIGARMKAAAQAKLAEAAKFLEENKKKDGVQTTETGLQYKIIKSGSGATPTATDMVSVHYEGKLINGEVFDSSIKRGEPASFQVGNVIPGWTEALQRMKVGDKWQLFIPPNLAYGANGRPPVIGPNEPLIFEVELLEVK